VSPSDLVPVAEAAKALGISAGRWRTLRCRRRKGLPGRSLPTEVKVGEGSRARHFVRLADLAAYLEAIAVPSTDSPRAELSAVAAAIEKQWPKEAAALRRLALLLPAEAPRPPRRARALQVVDQVEQPQPPAPVTP
jgi:hypothetical protein